MANRCPQSNVIWLLQCCNIIMLLASTGLSTRTPAETALEFQKNFPVQMVWAAETKDIDLPCDITSPVAGDSAKLVLWFKDTTGIPLYSLDLRGGGSLADATHSALSSELGQRLYFTASDEHPNEARLTIGNVHQSDEGVYRCRVDFFNSATQNVRVNLALVVPPDVPRIFDAQGKELAHDAGPFVEGHEMFLSCEVTGGHPPPTVSWWRDGVEMTHLIGHAGQSAMVNHLSINSVSREMNGMQLECRAKGSELVQAVGKTVVVQVHLPPLTIKIVSPNALLTAGKTTQLRCESWGSYPPATITWFLDGEPLRSANINIQSNHIGDGNLTVSILNLNVTSVNDGGELMCRAENPWFSDGPAAPAALEDKRIISVAYAPIVSVHLSNEDPSRSVTRAERENVTLKCRADARPAVVAYSWFKNEMRMSGENTETLHLTQLQRESAGSYSCGAQNAEGETRSSTITLLVQYAPYCKPGTEQHSVGAINMHSIPLRCEVEADPADSIRFSWTYNNTKNVSPVLNSRITSHGTLSTMTYLPQSDHELITLACWASNAVGHQVIPCLVHILPSKTPETPKSCELRNDTVLEVVCVAGLDGGLPQHFVLEIVAANPLYAKGFPAKSVPDFMDNNLSTMNDQVTAVAAPPSPVRRLIESIPEFKLVDLEPGREYRFLVYAQNAKGASYPPVELFGRGTRDSLGSNNEEENFLSVEDPTPAETSSKAKPGESRQFVLIICIVIGAFIGTCIVVTGIVFACRRRRLKPPETVEMSKQKQSLRTDVPSMYAADDGTGEEFTRSADTLLSCREDVLGGVAYGMAGPYGCSAVTESYVQYTDPSLSVFIADPDVIRANMEFTATGE